MKGIISVFGATGLQGSAVIDALLADGTFIPRALTRNPESEVSHRLKSRGVEVVKADLWNKESVKQAITGSEGVFGVTNFFDPSIRVDNPTGETEQGKTLVDACKEVGIKFFVWSTLPSAAKVSNGKFTNLNHFESKYAVEEYVKQSGLPNASVATGWFTENVWNWEYLIKTPSGAFDLVIPRSSATSTQVFTWVEKDLGPAVVALFKNYDSHKEEIWNHTFLVASARKTFGEFAQILSKALGQPVTFKRTEGSGLDEIDVMYDFFSTIGWYTDSIIPDPRLVALGVHFSHLEDFAEQKLKPRFS